MVPPERLVPASSHSSTPRHDAELKVRLARSSVSGRVALASSDTSSARSPLVTRTMPMADTMVASVTIESERASPAAVEAAPPFLATHVDMTLAVGTRPGMALRSAGTSLLGTAPGGGGPPRLARPVTMLVPPRPAGVSERDAVD